MDADTVAILVRPPLGSPCVTVTTKQLARTHGDDAVVQDADPCPSCGRTDQQTIIERRVLVGPRVLSGTQLACSCGWAMTLSA